MTIRQKELSFEKKHSGGKLIDLRGVRVGRLVVQRFDGYDTSQSGKEVRVDGCCLRRKSTQSCGCMARDLHTTHSLSGHYIYSIWLAIKQRTGNHKHKNFADYGGRGIKMCDRWRESAEAFFADMGERPTPKHTVERRDNDGDYEPGNCYWATRAEQNENTRQTRILEFNGVRLSVGKWAKRLGIQRKTITSRLDRLGWSVERALTTPARPKRDGLLQPH